MDIANSPRMKYRRPSRVAPTRFARSARTSSTRPKEEESRRGQGEAEEEAKKKAEEEAEEAEGQGGRRRRRRRRRKAAEDAKKAEEDKQKACDAAVEEYKKVLALAADCKSVFGNVSTDGVKTEQDFAVKVRS